ncbi:MAG: type II toxin-antitoxin system RelE/ParE family toxin [Opitutales bacterium]
MKKPLKVADRVADLDIPAILRYHRERSPAKAVRLLAEYVRIIDAISKNPRVARLRKENWRVVAFRSGPYLLYYSEQESFWLVAGVFHAARDPDWIQAQLLIRELGPG